MNIDIVYIRTKAGEKLHRGVRIDDGPLMTAEGCNLDDSVHPEKLTAYQAFIEDWNTCERCCPEEKILA